MLKSSLRHVARSSSAHPAQTRPSLSPPITASFSSRSHQRRHSSSKPPIPPNDGARNIPASSVKTVGTPREKEAPAEQSPGTEQEQASTDMRIPKRKVPRQKTSSGQDRGNQWTRSMPSVPSTQHLSIDDVTLSSFFSLHRPMSVTNSIPHEADSKAIDAIFASKKQSSRQGSGPQDVIYTIASAVQKLEGNIAQQQQKSQSQQSHPRRTDITTALTQHHNQQASQSDPNQTQHLDGQPPQINIRTPKGVQLMIQEVARHFRPYNTPPAPVPMSDADLDMHEAEMVAEEEQARDLEREIENQDQDNTSTSRQRTLRKFKGNDDLRSRQFFTHKAPMVRIKDPRARGALGQDLRFPEAEAPSPIGRVRRGGYPAQKEREIRIYRPSFYAISVKRQRRLKMKKHKYKKLMRKTRNQRQRLHKV